LNKQQLDVFYSTVAGLVDASSDEIADWSAVKGLLGMVTAR
jgi:hypothetical protein